jgi:hypothetical protein
MERLLQDCSLFAALFAVDKQGAIFGFGGGGSDVAEDAGRVEDGAVAEGVSFVVVAKVEVSAGAAARLCFVEVASVAVNVALCCWL